MYRVHESKWLSSDANMRIFQRLKCSMISRDHVPEVPYSIRFWKMSIAAKGGEENGAYTWVSAGTGSDVAGSSFSLQANPSREVRKPGTRTDDPPGCGWRCLNRRIKRDCRNVDNVKYFARRLEVMWCGLVLLALDVP